MNRLGLLALILIVLTACSQQLGNINLTASNNGASLDVSLNQTLVITLDSNITTGYKWNLVNEPDAKVLKLLGSDYINPITAMPGRGGTEVWRFQAVGKGAATLTLSYFRPFDPKQVDKEYSLYITVK